MSTLDDEWDRFICDGDCGLLTPTVQPNVDSIPKCSSIYISTKTVIAYLNEEVDLKNIFWQLQIIPYTEPREGIVKKQMKFNSTTPEEVSYIESQQEQYEYSSPVIIHHIENPDGRIKYKDSRKVSVGISKKDLVTLRINQKGAFYNCFVLIVRAFVDKKFKEYHVKVFNTGKLEMPGVQSQEQVDAVVSILISCLRPQCPSVQYVEGSEETVLINSNFTCGFFINRQTLYEKLRQVYSISSVYDPCTYPGLQCKIYYNQEGELSHSTTDGLYVNAVSFMIFRTGSILIVGKCTEPVLYKIFDFIKSIIHEQYHNIVEHNCVHVKKDAKRKTFKRMILCRQDPSGKTV